MYNLFQKTIRDGIIDIRKSRFEFDDKARLWAGDSSLYSPELLALLWRLGIPQKILRLPDYACDHRWLQNQAELISGEFRCSPDLTHASLQEWAWALGAMEMPVDGPSRPASEMPSFVEVHSGIRFLPVPRGTFKMGAPRTDRAQFHDNGQYRVGISRDFWMGKTPVTQRQWEAVMGTCPSQFPDPDAPVESISWFEAVEFCERLSSLAAATGALPPGLTYRLPSEAEWEYACRAGQSCRDSRIQDLHRVAWHDKVLPRTAPVGGKAPNPWGFHDMLGNVNEWCQDWHAEYPRLPQIDPCRLAIKKQLIGSARIFRGGSYECDPCLCLPSARYSEEPEYQSPICGLRIVCGQPFVDSAYYLKHLAPQDDDVWPAEYFYFLAGEDVIDPETS